MKHRVRRLGSAPFADDGYVLMSNAPDSDTLIVFVHGFLGAMDTWGRFPAHILTDPSFGRADVVFYDYDSLTVSAAISGAKLAAFLGYWAEFNRSQVAAGKDQASPKTADPTLELIVGDPATRDSIVEIYQTSDLSERRATPYRSILLVAHSLGAVVCRSAVVEEAKREASPWLSLAKLVLFAPAHYGSPLSGDAMNLGSSILGALSWNTTKVALRMSGASPTPEDLSLASPLLQHLLERWRKADTWRSKAPPVHAVFFGEHESVVAPLGFDGDPPIEILPFHDHVSICKPNARYRDPIAIVMKASGIGNDVADCLKRRRQLVEGEVRRLKRRLKEFAVVRASDDYREKTLKTLLRDHGEKAVKTCEVPFRDSLDRVLVRLSQIEILAALGVLDPVEHLPCAERLSLLEHPDVARYYGKYYPMPLVTAFFGRLNGQPVRLSGLGQPEIGDTCVELAETFLWHSRVFEASSPLYNFKRALDDFSLAIGGRKRAHIGELLSKIRSNLSNWESDPDNAAIGTATFVERLSYGERSFLAGLAEFLDQMNAIRILVTESEEIDALRRRGVDVATLRRMLATYFGYHCDRFVEKKAQLWEEGWGDILYFSHLASYETARRRRLRRKPFLDFRKSRFATMVGKPWRWLKRQTWRAGLRWKTKEVLAFIEDTEGRRSAFARQMTPSPTLWDSLRARFVSR